MYQRQRLRHFLPLLHFYASHTGLGADQGRLTIESVIERAETNTLVAESARAHSYILSKAGQENLSTWAVNALAVNALAVNVLAVNSVSPGVPHTYSF